MRWTPVALLLLASPAVVSAQGVTEEVEGGGAALSPEDLAPPPGEPEPGHAPEGSEGAPSVSAQITEVEATSETIPAPAGPLAPEPLRYTLDNGLDVILQPVPGRRFAAVLVSYHVGSADAPSGWSGLAHLTEHLMFSGTDRLGEVETYLQLEAAGAVQRNGETTPDRSIFYSVLPGAQLRWALWIEAHRMARLLAGLDAGRVARQRAVVLHEGWERGVYGWRGLLTRSLYDGVLPAEHPYRGIVERADDVRAVRLRHVQYFFQRYYAPDNATLVIVGGFDPGAAREAIEARFGPIVRSGRAPEPLEAAPLVALEAERRIDVAIQDRRDRLRIAWPTPALYAEGDAELDVISTLLAGERQSPLRAALIESGLAVELEVIQRSHALGSVFTIEAVPAEGRAVEELREAIDAALGRVRSGGFDEEATARAAARWVRRVRLRTEDLEARARALATATERYVPSLERERRRYEAVDADAVRRAMARWLPARRRLVLRGLASPSHPASGEVLSDRVITP